MKSPSKRVSFSTEDNSVVAGTVESAAKILNSVIFNVLDSKQQMHQRNKVFDSPAVTSRSNESTESSRVSSSIEKELDKIRQNKISQHPKTIEYALEDNKGQARGLGFRSLSAGLFKSDMSAKSKYNSNTERKSSLLLSNSAIKQLSRESANSLIDLYPSGSTIHIHKITASNLSSVDLIGINDPYILINFNDGVWNGRTPVISDGGSDVEWSFQPNEPSMQFPLTAADLQHGVLSIHVLDSNSFRLDFLIGTGEMELGGDSYEPIDSNLGSMTLSTTLKDIAGRVGGTVTVCLLIKKPEENIEGDSDSADISGPVSIYGYGEPSSELLLSSKLPPVPVLYTDVFKTVRSQNFIETSGYKWAIAKERAADTGKVQKVKDKKLEDQRRESSQKRNPSDQLDQLMVSPVRVSSSKAHKRVISLHTADHLALNSGSIIEAGKFKKQMQKELLLNNSCVRRGSTFYTDMDDEATSPQPSQTDKNKSMLSGDVDVEGSFEPAAASSEVFGPTSKLLSSRNPNKIKKAKLSKFKIVTMMKNMKSLSPDNVGDYCISHGIEEDGRSRNLMDVVGDYQFGITSTSPSHSGSARSWSQVSEKNANGDSKFQASHQPVLSARSSHNSRQDKSKWPRPQSSPPFRRTDVEKQLFPITEMSSHSGLDSHHYESNNNSSNNHDSRQQYHNQQNNSSNGHYNSNYHKNSKPTESATTSRSDTNANFESLSFATTLLDSGREGSDLSRWDIKNRPKSSNVQRLPLLIHVLDAAEIRKTIQ